MADYADAKHRPHAIHTGEKPDTLLSFGPDAIRVTLDTWGPKENLFAAMYDALQSNWGESPSRTVSSPCRHGHTYHLEHVHTDWECLTGWCRLTDDQRAYVEAAFAGKTLPQILEGIQFHFTVDGVTRAETHQMVRTRVGAAFMQHGGRDNDWRHRGFTIPETVSRAMQSSDRHPQGTLRDGRQTCITDWAPIEDYLRETGAPSLRVAVTRYLAGGKALYSALVDAGIPWQDARRFLWTGTQTYIHALYTFQSLRGVLGNRLEHVMDWEVNCVAQLMLREVMMKCPPIFGRFLGSHSDQARTAKFAGLESWPPDGKWPNPYEVCKTCGHTQTMHVKRRQVAPGAPEPERVDACMACDTEAGAAQPAHAYEGVDALPRTHTNLQMPYFVLAPESYAGGPVRWLWTNGTYPHARIQNNED